MELAVSAPFLVLLTVGVVDFGRAMRTEMVASSAARAGLQYATRDSASAASTTAVETAAKLDAGSPSSMGVTVTTFCTCSVGGAQVGCSTTCTGKRKYMQVETSVPFTQMMNLPILSKSAITSRAVGRIE